MSAGLLVIRRGGDHRAWGDSLCWDSLSSCISSVSGYHGSFLLHLQSTVSPCSLCCNTCVSLPGIYLLPVHFLFTVTISLDGHFLQNEAPELILTQNSSSPLPDLSITLFDSNNNRVIPEIQKKNLQEYIVDLKKLETMDSGTWVCQIHSNSPLINQDISFGVKVLGM